MIILQEIQERIPNDPLEAELLMMAEAVAGKDEESSSESEDEQTEGKLSKIRFAQIWHVSSKIRFAQIWDVSSINLLDLDQLASEEAS